MTETLEQTARRLEAFETPQWAIDAILKVELMTSVVVDPCCGRGIMTEAAKAAGYETWAADIHDWGYQCHKCDFLSLETDILVGGSTIFMNPPFSKAQKFVLKAKELGARKIICFQRFSWWESDERRKFWDQHPPNRIYICGPRATCWRYDIDPCNPINPETGKKYAGTTTAHAWFVWERGHPVGPVISRLYKVAA